jgi:hypothetical protein
MRRVVSAEGMSLNMFTTGAEGAGHEHVRVGWAYGSLTSMSALPRKRTSADEIGMPAKDQTRHDVLP